MRADGYTHTCGTAPCRTHNYTLPEQRRCNRARGLLQIYKNEIGIRWNVFHVPLGQSVIEKFSFRTVHGDALLNMIAVVPGGQRCDLCDTVCVERHSYFIQSINDLTGTDAVADSQACQSEDF